ncbi:MAG TPA: M14 family zinc carboxypeptidase [Solirubrobacteraceae bacterium]
MRRLAGALLFLALAAPSYRSYDDYLRELGPSRFALPVRSVEGREIPAVAVGGGPGAPVQLVFGLTHGREWPSGEVALLYARELATSRDPRLVALRRRLRTIVVPVVNPDGLVRTQSGQPLWRRNARGVDLNRNFGAFWGGPGASTLPASDTYRGPGPWSEPETQAVHALSAGLAVTSVVSLHNVGALVLRPPGFRALGVAPDEAGLRRLGDAMAVAAGYRSAYAADLYEATGALEDWSYLAQGAYGFTIELGENDGDNSFTGHYDTHVTQQYQGSARVGGGALPHGGVREALLLAAEEAQDPRDHALVVGRAPAGHVLRLRKSFVTMTSPVCVDDPCSATTPAMGLADALAITLTVPASGRFAWHVGPSTRPFVARGGGREAWTLECLDGGAVAAAHQVVVGRGERASVDPCVAGSAVRVARNPAARVLRVVGVRRSGGRVRARLVCARSCTVHATLRGRSARAVLLPSTARTISLPAARGRLTVRAVDSVGERAKTTRFLR